MLAATMVGFVIAPIAMSLLAIADVLRARFAFPLVRMYLFGLQYLFNDSVEIVLAPLMWVRFGFGKGFKSTKSRTAHQRLQFWSLELLEKRAEQLLGLKTEMDETSRKALQGKTTIVIGRHVSWFDASLPAVLCHEEGLGVRGVVMAEMLADPGFDLLYGRLGSIFIPRDDGQKARSTIAEMAESIVKADEPTAVVLFPEGRMFHPTIRDKMLAKLESQSPERAERLAPLQDLLPPRPGGLFMLFDALPDAEIAVVEHNGLERLGRLKDIVGRVPICHPVQVTATRIGRHEVPDGEQARLHWLDELWLNMQTNLKAS